MLELKFEIAVSSSSILLIGEFPVMLLEREASDHDAEFFVLRQLIGKPLKLELINKFAYLLVSLSGLGENLDSCSLDPSGNSSTGQVPQLLNEEIFSRNVVYGYRRDVSLLSIGLMVGSHVRLNGSTCCSGRSSGRLDQKVGRFFDS
ncbi:hypothetical protein NPIL_43551 [Nephila pilipes]|uniref:Uncharacterized protein n=1 Tax=Nephila pilipes TaxID=299642 RepID=A0A8X6IG78_NEPPI|nr:hypothetical protein NPIL_43551 [Nephila pilipes]